MNSWFENIDHALKHSVKEFENNHKCHHTNECDRFNHSYTKDDHKNKHYACEKYLDTKILFMFPSIVQSLKRILETFNQYLEMDHNDCAIVLWRLKIFFFVTFWFFISKIENICWCINIPILFVKALNSFRTHEC